MLYIITVGEVGNEVGHAVKRDYPTDAAAIRAAKRAVQPYRGDGWWRVTTYGGEMVDRGGRRAL